jgi:maltose/maltodextrin transport system permease protein
VLGRKQSVKKRSVLGTAMVVLGALALAAGLALVVTLHTARQHALATAALALVAVAVVIYVSPRFYAWRYVLPSALAVLFFLAGPILFSFGISFTNYSSSNLLSFERATEVLLTRSNASDVGMDFRLYATGDRYRFEFTADDDARFVSDPVALGPPVHVPLRPADPGAPESGDPITLKQIVALQAELQLVVAVLPDGTELRQSNLRRFIAMRPAFSRNADGTLTDTADGSILHADHDTGYWRHADGTRVEPGFRTFVGGENYDHIFTDRRFFQPVLRVFAWTVAFATLNTLFTFGIGVVFAALLNWEALRYRNFFRIMLFVPYAVPSFISVPVFRGLFNENLGEINLVLGQLFNIQPGWFSDANLARSMMLTVNTWLGYPYMMILCMGLIKAIPPELYEASAVDGAGPLANFFRITLPLILRPIAPLLVASFAFNFNNIALVELLTEGGPDFLDTQVPAGATDLMASYTYRIAFRDSGEHYALACAISTIIFVIVAVLAMVNLRLFKVSGEDAS